jgi:hypothetical protein
MESNAQRALPMGKKSGSFLEEPARIAAQTYLPLLSICRQTPPQQTLVANPLPKMILS